MRRRLGEEIAKGALADIGVTVRDLGVLRVIASGEAQSQQEAAAVLGVDRTSMVALLDALERQGIVARRPSEQDWRRNILALTDHGWEVFRQAESRYSETERDFTATPERPDSGKRCRPCSARTAVPEQAPGRVLSRS